MAGKSVEPAWSLDPVPPLVLNETDVGLFLLDERRRVQHWNRWMVEATGVCVSDAEDQYLPDLFPAVAKSPLQEALDAAVEWEQTTLLTAHNQGETLRQLGIDLCQSIEAAFGWLVIVKPLADSSGRVLIQVYRRSDVAGSLLSLPQEWEACRDKELHAHSILGAITDAVITTDREGHIDYMNLVAEKLTGWRYADAAGKPLRKVFRVIGQDADPLYKAVNDCLQRGEQERGKKRELVLAHRDGIGVAVDRSIAPITNQIGEIRGVVVVFRDVSQERRLAAQVDWQAAHDALTGLANRTSFDAKLEALLNEARLVGKIHSMLYLDLDQFKIVNDACGHVAGDELLRQVAAALSQHIRRDDILARLGGDEFGVLLANCSGQAALRIANEMRQAIVDFRFSWNDKAYAIGVSIGVVAINAESESVKQVLAAADAACYAAKDGGRNQVNLYQPNKGEAAQRQGEMRWVSRLQAALDEDRFVLYAQPIVPVDGRAGKQGHSEILLRMLDENGERVMPGDFIPAAERYGLMPKIDRWVVGQVFGLIKRYRQRLIASGSRFAINLSGASLGDEDTLLFIGGQMSECDIPPGMISFEITETAAIANIASAGFFIRTLKQAGCQFSLDDFGSGLSSFAYLKNLPVDYLKIDGAFVRDLVDDPVDFSIVQAISQVGQVMGLQTIAEFVEDQRTLRRLREIGVDYAQGYGIARPAPLLDSRGELLLPLKAD